MKKIGGVVVSHGRLANELLAAAEQVVGDLPHIRAVSIGWHDDVEAASAEVERSIETVSDGVWSAFTDRYVWWYADQYLCDVFQRK